MSRKCLFFGEPTGNRTQDLRIKSPVLYQLSYRLDSVLYLKKIDGLYIHRKTLASRGGSRTAPTHETHNITS